MKKILFFTPSLNVGGVERIFLTYAKALLKTGYDVSYLTVYDCGILQSASENLPVVSLHKTRLRNAIFSLIKYLKNNKIDIIITGDSIPNAIITLIVRIFTRKTQNIVSHHNYFVGEYHSLMSKLAVKHIYNFATTVVSVSQGITQMLVEMGVKQEKIHTIYNPLDIEQIQTLSNCKLQITLPENFIVFVGRLAPIKNLFFLLETFCEFTKSHSNIDLVFVGDGTVKSDLQKKAEILNIKDRIHFTGDVINPFPIIKKAKAVVLSSFAEALPTVILESFALGKTVVSTPTKGAIDLLENEKYGYLSDSFNDACAFAALIEKAMICPKNSLLLQTRAKEFCIEDKVKVLAKLFY